MEDELTKHQLPPKPTPLPNLMDRYPFPGAPLAEDAYMHSYKGLEFLCDASGILELPPTPEQAHDPMVACSSLFFCEREDQFDILE